MANYKKKTNGKNATGRPESMTPAVIAKLKQAFALGMNEKDACYYAEISDDTLRRYKKDHKEFCVSIERLQAKPVMKAYAVIDNALNSSDINTARWLLERKRKDDFTTKTEIVQPEPVKVYITPEQQSAALEHINAVINSGS